MTPKKLYRSQGERLLAGVAGGIAEYFALDPIIVRIGFVLLTLLNGVGLVIYLILFLIVTLEPIGANPATQSLNDSVENTTDKTLVGTPPTSKTAADMASGNPAAAGAPALAGNISVAQNRFASAAREIRERANSLAREFRDRTWWTEGKNIFGIIIVAIGILFLLERTIGIPMIRWKLIWPALLILLGFYILTKRRT